MKGNLKILFLPFIIISQISAGQTIVRSSFSCLGSSASQEGIILRQTIGQPSNTYVFNKGGLALRQGFQQSVASFNLSKAIEPLDFSLAPNPAADKTLIKFHEEISRSIIYVRDIKGNLLSETKVEFLSEKWLDLKDFKPGIYLITVISGNGKGSRKLIITN